MSYLDMKFGVQEERSGGFALIADFPTLGLDIREL